MPPGIILQYQSGPEVHLSNWSTVYLSPFPYSLNEPAFFLPFSSSFFFFFLFLFSRARAWLNLEKMKRSNRLSASTRKVFVLYVYYLFFLFLCHIYFRNIETHEKYYYRFIALFILHVIPYDTRVLKTSSCSVSWTSHLKFVVLVVGTCTWKGACTYIKQHRVRCWKIDSIDT